MFHIVINEKKGLHVLEGTLGSGKKKIVKYLTCYFQTQGKGVVNGHILSVFIQRHFYQWTI